ncbi:hypothetical protein BRADI_3g32036v3 [Brachypodium distachyon]|uniref:Reverse transcriptase zinc-binding domain-containing protein n=1 Tax=Brachypodium distachyon TaxID=15368 RepID=A0A0Q3Q7G1_BRADI|nr:hypothetical protein BRADI_3g32036v3 [Brachypodium distachyon]
MPLKKNFQLPAYDCVLCDGCHLETKICWNYICPNFTPLQNVHRNIALLKRELKVTFFMEIITLVTWSIWKIRNDFIFNQRRPSLYRCKQIFKEELNLVFHRAKRKSYFGFADWINSFR